MTVPSTLAELVRTAASERGQQTALVADGYLLTFQDLDLMSSRMAAGMSVLGVDPGDRVAYLGRNSTKYFVTLFASAKLGAVTVPLNWRLAYPELSSILEDAQVKLSVVDVEFGDVANRLFADRAVPGEVREVAAVGLDDWWSQFSLPLAAVDVPPDTTALQLYTSGTTGKPKGVMSSHAAVLESLQTLADVAGIGQSSVSLCTLPTFHIGGTSWSLTGLFAGCPTVLLRDANRDRILESVRAEQATVMIAVPAVVQQLVDALALGDPRVRSLERIYYGAGPMVSSVLERAIATIDCNFVQGFGMTELPLITALRPEFHIPGSPFLRSCGQLVPGTEARVIDPVTLGDVIPGEVGELWARSNRTMSGYWNQPDETSKAITEGGWLRTGDAVHVDSDGFFFLHDRLKDVIISGGENIYSAEVENALSAHPDVVECAVIGVPSPRWTETVKAVVVLNRPSSANDERSLIEFCRGRLAPYKCPTSVDFIESIPRTMSGKIQKNELREQFWSDDGDVRC